MIVVSLRFKLPRRIALLATLCVALFTQQHRACAANNPAAPKPPVDNLVYNQINLLPYISVLEDTSGTLSYEDIVQPKQQARFAAPTQDALILNNPTAVYWLHINTRTLQPIQDRHVIYIPYRPFDKLSFYAEQDQQNIEKLSHGLKELLLKKDLVLFNLADGKIIAELRKGTLEAKPFDNGEYIHHRFWVERKYIDKNLQLYLRIDNRSTPFQVSAPMYLLDAAHYQKNELRLYLVATAYYSMMLCLLLFNVFIFIRTREGSHFYYSAYLLLTIAISSFIDGTWYSIMNGNAGTGAYHFFRTAFVVQNILHLIFVLHIIQIKNMRPWLGNIVTVILIGGFLLAILDPFLPITRTINSLNLLYVSLIASTLPIVATIAAIKAQPYGRTLTLMTFAHSTLLLLFFLGWNGALGHNVITPWLAHTAYLSEALLFSLVLASQFIQIRSQAEISRQKYQLAEQEANKEREANLEKSRFLARASHDLRQPLHSISLFAAALHLKVSNQEQKQLTLNMQESIRSMQSMFSDILDISRIEAGMLSVQLQPIAVNDMLQSLYLELAPLAEEKHLRFYVRRCKNWFVQSDPVLLKRILRNLVINAIRYTPSGTVLVGCHFRGQHLRIDVLDSGMGIAQKHQRTIFNEFVRADDHAQEGLGLGLAIVKRLAKTLDHHIELVSAPGKGSRFSITAPLVNVLAHSTNTPVNTKFDNSMYTLDGIVIAVIDDDKSVRDSLTAFLDSLGCEVISGRDANSIQQQLATLQRMPDLVIADYYLGQGQTGTAEARYLLEYLGDPTIPILVITGDTSADTLQHLQSSYINVLNKPVDPALLRQCIEEKIFGT